MGGEGIGKSFPVDSKAAKRNPHMISADDLDPIRDARGTPIDVLIKRDHDSFRDLNSRYHQSHSTEEKRSLLHTFIREVSLHSAAEELVVYPTLEHLSSGNRGERRAPGSLDVERLRNQHHAVKESLYELDKVLPKVDLGDLGQKRRVEEVLARAVGVLEEHMKLEESSDVPQLVQSLDKIDLQELGEIFATAKITAPTRPHPSAPDHGGITEIVASLPAAVMDRLKDLGRKFAEKREGPVA